MATAGADGVAGAPPGWGLLLALACTAAVCLVHGTRAVKSEAADLREALWGLRFQPLTGPRRALLAALGGTGLLALACHAAARLGPGAAVLVLGLVLASLRGAGLLRAPRTGAKAQAQGAEEAGRLGEPGAPLPVWILTGFLGSGKTTLVNRLVRQASGSPRLLVIENEAGETSLDAELVIEASGSSESVLLLNGGCACCKVRGDLCDLMRDEVLGRRVLQAGVEGVVLECSGLADPKAVVQTFLLDDDLRHRLELREIVAVVDAAHVGSFLGPGAAASASGQRAALVRLVEEQIAFASLVLLNKLDRARGEAQLEGLRSAVRSVNATAEVLECSYCGVDVGRVLGGGVRSRTGAWSPGRALLDVDCTRPHAGGPSPTGLGVRCLTVRVEGELDLDAFNRWVLTTLADAEVLRAKGILAVAGHDRKLAFQAVHAAFDGTPLLAARWAPGEPRFSQIVLIGYDLQEDLIEWGLKRCRA